MILSFGGRKFKCSHVVAKQRFQLCNQKSKDERQCYLQKDDDLENRVICFFCVECRLFCPAERNFMSERQNPSHERIRTRQRTTVFRLGNSQYLEDEKVQNPEAKMIVPGN